MPNEKDKAALSIWVSSSTTGMLRRVAEQAGLITDGGRMQGQGSISQLVEKFADALEAGTVTVTPESVEGAVPVPYIDVGAATRTQRTRLMRMVREGDRFMLVEDDDGDL